MMVFMSPLMGIMLYNRASGLNLYIMASNFFGVLEQWRIRQHLKEEEARLNASGSGASVENDGDDESASGKGALPPASQTRRSGGSAKRGLAAAQMERGSKSRRKTRVVSRANATSAAKAGEVMVGGPFAGASLKSRGL